MCFGSNRRIFSRQNSRVLAEIQMKKRVGVVITGAKCLRKRRDTWKEWHLDDEWHRMTQYQQAQQLTIINSVSGPGFPLHWIQEENGSDCLLYLKTIDSPAYFVRWKLANELQYVSSPGKSTNAQLCSAKGWIYSSKYYQCNLLWKSVLGSGFHGCRSLFWCINLFLHTVGQHSHQG